MTKSYGKDDNGLLKWNWNGPRDAADIRKILDPSSPASPSHWSNMVNVSNINMRPLHLPKKREYPAPKIPITKFRPAPVSGGHPTTRTERIQNYRLEHFPEYARLGEGQMCVTIAHCCNCHLHQKTTRHDDTNTNNATNTNLRCEWRGRQTVGGAQLTDLIEWTSCNASCW